MIPADRQIPCSVWRGRQVTQVRSPARLHDRLVVLPCGEGGGGSCPEVSSTPCPPARQVLWRPHSLRLGLTAV